MKWIDYHKLSPLGVAQGSQASEELGLLAAGLLEHQENPDAHKVDIRHIWGPDVLFVLPMLCHQQCDTMSHGRPDNVATSMRPSPKSACNLLPRELDLSPCHYNWMLTSCKTLRYHAQRR